MLSNAGRGTPEQFLRSADELPQCVAHSMCTPAPGTHRPHSEEGGSGTATRVPLVRGITPASQNQTTRNRPSESECARRQCRAPVCITKLDSYHRNKCCSL